MALYRRFFDTDATTITMLVMFSTSYTTNAASITMILAFVLIIQEDTDGAPVSS